MKFSALILLIFLVSNIHAQTESITWGTESPTVNTPIAPDILGYADGHYFVLRNNYKKFYLESYDMNTMNQVYSVMLEQKYQNQRLIPLHSFIFNNQPIVLLGALDDQFSYLHYFIQPFDAKTMQPGAMVEIAKREYNGTYGIHPMLRIDLAGENYFKPDLIVALNEDGSHLMVGINTLPFNATGTILDTDSRKEMELYYMDESFKVVSTIPFKLPFDYFTRRQYTISSDNKLILCGSEDKLEIIDKRETWVPEKFHLLKYDLATGEMIQQEIFSGMTGIGNFAFGLTDDGQVLITGLLQNEDQGLTGGFMIKYDQSFSQVYSNTYEFDKDFIASTMTPKEVEKNEEPAAAFDDYFLKGITQTSDGGMIVTIEQFSMTNRVVATPNGTSTSTSYTFGGVIVIKLNKDGQVVWKKVIRKNQLSVNDQGKYSSFFGYVHGNKFHLVFNEQEEDMVDPFSNYTQDPKSKKFFVNRVTIDMEGNVNKDKLYEFTDKKHLYLIPDGCEKISDTEIILYARTKSAELLGKLVLE